MKKWISKTIVILMILPLCLTESGCKNWKRTTKGGAIGAGAGGVIGGAIGAQSDNTVVGAILGAAIGGAAGSAIGLYMDKQAHDIQRDVKGAKVERVGEGIRITFESGILFDVNKYELKDEAKANIKELAKVLQKYDDTNVLIEGHTDASGPDEANMILSEKRADAVADYAKILGVAGPRMVIKGYGEKQPVADNETSEGKQQNRRVEIGIMANKKLKRAAKNGDIKVD
ncbi:MAG: OmpA family protein [Bacteroidota bacterium]|jgi:outer membrane protein OmpA-like peptidoglycan-associated protein|nr:OmpA family protein [Bacteroidota bacterium]